MGDKRLHSVQGAVSAPVPYRLTAEFREPPAQFAGCFTTFYHLTLDLPETGALVTDYLQPEWANIRFFCGTAPDAEIAAHKVSGAPFVGTGPSALPCRFTLGPVRMWGVGFLPLGWARFVRLPAAEFANKLCDGAVHPFCAPFRPLAESLFGPEPDEAAELDRIIAFFRDFRAYPLPEEKRIVAIHAALVDPEVVTVADLVSRVAASQRTVERLCHRHFGFSPKLLLRRQRFARSLAHFMLDPTMSWIDALDGQYHDQAQFVRDFREFMGTTPREYAARPHPILERFMQERMRVHGSAVQTTDRPDGTPPSSIDAPANAASMLGSSGRSGNRSRQSPAAGPAIC